MIRRVLRWAGRVVLVLLLLPVVLVALVFVVANTDFGRRLIEAQTASLTGGMVRIQGLAGRFPDALTAQQIQVSDGKGAYVTVSDLTLDWSPRMLLDRVAQIDRLSAGRVEFARLPVSEGGSSSSGGSFTLPVRVDLRQLDIPWASIGAPVAGAAATLSLTGSGELRTLTTGMVHLLATRLDMPGVYRVNGDISAQSIAGGVTVNEPANGLIAQIAGLPDLGAIAAQASVNGPSESLSAQLGLTAGPLQASAQGTVDLTHQAADLTVHAQAPAMRPAPGVGWQSVLVDASVKGPFTRPDANGTVRIDALTAAGARIGALAAAIKGNAGQVELHATATDLHVPGLQPDVFAAAPVVLDASAQLDAADRPVAFALRHPLIAATGTARTTGEPSVRAHLELQDLAPLAQVGGIDLRGSTALDVNATTTSAVVTGTIAITGGMAPVPALIGDSGHIDLAAAMHGQDITLSNLALNGKAVTVTASGGMADQTITLDWSVALSDLSAIQPDLKGTLEAKGHASGASDNLAVRADIGTDLAARGYQSGRVTAHIQATGLPDSPKAQVTAGGTLLDAPLSLDLTAGRTNGVIQADIGALDWKSLKAEGSATLAPPATLPTGHLRLSFTRLADLRPLIGQPIEGAAEATLDADDRQAHLTVKLRDAGLAGSATIAAAALEAKIANPAGDPAIDASLTAEGISASTVKGASARVSAKGKLNALAVTVSAAAPDLTLTSAGRVNVTEKTLALASLEAGWRQQVLRLLGPARVNFADGVAVDRLRLGFRQAELSVAGSVGTKLDLTATLRNLPADIAAIVDPSLAADGSIAADARLTGTIAKPEGTVKLTATGVRLRSGPGRALPVANLIGTIGLMGTSARVDTRLTAGPSNLTVTGSAPLSATGALDLRSEGAIDLAMLNPLLTSQGRRASGSLTLNAAIGGTTAAPSVTGAAELKNGDVSDYAIGAHVSALTASLQASGETIRLASFSGKAGEGTIGGTGTISLAGAMPVDLHFTARNARPLASDLLTALIDANLTVQGEVKGDMQAGGTLTVRRADIQIPDKLPSGVAVLPVRIAGVKPPPPPAPVPPSRIALNLTVSAPEQVFIRGRGLDAELGGTIRIRGTTATPVPTGGLELRRGTLSVVGTTLTFSEGTISFAGAGLTDPALHFVATSASSAITATLTISGTASDPKITLSSVPDMPQDEILAQLLFNTSTSKLNPFQLAQIAAALASLSGATGSFDPLGNLRSSLGLDRLSVGSGSSGSPTLEAGRYIARGVYLGATQSASGGAPQATIQVDIAKGLKLQTTAGSSASSATGSTGSADAASVGLTYGFEY